MLSFFLWLQATGTVTPTCDQRAIWILTVWWTFFCSPKTTTTIIHDLPDTWHHSVFDKSCQILYGQNLAWNDRMTAWIEAHVYYFSQYWPTCRFDDLKAGRIELVIQIQSGPFLFKRCLASSFGDWLYFIWASSSWLPAGSHFCSCADEMMNWFNSFYVWLIGSECCPAQ